MATDDFIEDQFRSNALVLEPALHDLAHTNRDLYLKYLCLYKLGYRNCLAQVLNETACTVQEPRPEVIDLGGVPDQQKYPQFELNHQQQFAYDEILKWASNIIGPKTLILSGYAGTGKTSLMARLAPSLKQAVFCAPTNKATKELKKRLPQEACLTIYSLLGLRMEQQEDRLVLKKAERSKIAKYRIVVLDECGMVSTELFEYLLDVIRNGVKILFVGDPKQLPPIGERRSPVWKSTRTLRLTKVERHDNQILEFVTHVRTTPLSDIVLESNYDDTGGVYVMSDNAFEKRINRFVDGGFFDEEARCIAWRNRTVRNLNLQVRRKLYGKNADKEGNLYMVGDRIVFTSPIDYEYVNIHTDDDGKVIDKVIAPHPIIQDLTCYHLTIMLDNSEVLIQTVHESCQLQFESMLNKLAQEARKPGNGILWKEFWGKKNSVASIVHGWSLTTHRAQGSTYKYAFVDASDILSNSNSREAKSCLYVASSRPTTSLFLR